MYQSHGSSVAVENQSYSISRDRLGNTLRKSDLRLSSPTSWPPSGHGIHQVIKALARPLNAITAASGLVDEFTLWWQNQPCPYDSAGWWQRWGKPISHWSMCHSPRKTNYPHSFFCWIVELKASRVERIFCWINKPLSVSRWWFHILFIFTPIWWRFPIWLIFFKGVETTN